MDVFLLLVLVVEASFKAECPLPVFIFVEAMGLHALRDEAFVVFVRMSVFVTLVFLQSFSKGMLAAKYGWGFCD